jgi:hypothetical protein
LLKAGIHVAAGIMAVANIPAVACFPAFHFHGHQFSTDIQLVKLPHFWKVTATTAISSSTAGRKKYL